MSHRFLLVRINGNGWEGGIVMCREMGGDLIVRVLMV